MNKSLLILLLITFTAFLSLLLAAYPRFTDDKDLVFEPVDVPIEKEVREDLMRIVKDKSSPVILNQQLLDEIERTVDDIDLFHLYLIVAIIKRIELQEIELPQKYKDFSFYESLVKISLEREVYRVKKIIDTKDDLNQVLYLSPIEETISDKISYGILGLSEFFTFQQNRTLNDFWTAVQNFDFKEDDYLDLPCDIKEFRYSNFFGNYLLGCSAPTTSQLKKSIEEITSNKMLGENSEPLRDSESSS